MVSEVIFPRFWRVVCIGKCFRNFEIVIGNAVSKMFSFLRKIEQIAISQKRHFRSKFQNSENAFQYKLPPKTWEKSPQKPLLTTQKCFFGHFTYKKNYVKLSLCPILPFGILMVPRPLF